ncbi:MAG: crotonase/enoyl-CoA hydratase family protein [Pseudomonadota bacterium]
MSNPVSVESKDSHVRITMDDGKANALSFAMLEGVNAALDQAVAENKAVVLLGRPGKFSAGFDLNVMAKMDEDTARLLRLGSSLSVRLMDFKTPVILGVSGHALAMGALLCLSADYRIGISGDYKLGLNEVAIGMTLPWFGVELARDRLAKAHFNQAVNLARVYDPASAVEAGYLDEAVPEADFLSRLEDMALTVSSLNMTAHHNSKRRVREDFFARYEQAIERDFSEGGLIAAP